MLGELRFWQLMQSWDGVKFRELGKVAGRLWISDTGAQGIPFFFLSHSSMGSFLKCIYCTIRDHQ